MVVHGFMESDSYSPLLNISVIPQVTYRLVTSHTPSLYILLQIIYSVAYHIFYIKSTISVALETSIHCVFFISFNLSGTCHLEENVQL